MYALYITLQAVVSHPSRANLFPDSIMTRKHCQASMLYNGNVITTLMCHLYVTIGNKSSFCIVRANNDEKQSFALLTMWCSWHKLVVSDEFLVLLIILSEKPKHSLLVHKI